MGLTETITWVDPAVEKPDDSLAVLLNHPGLDEPVWMGYYQDDAWYSADGVPIEEGAVKLWAELPIGIGL